MAVRRVVIMGAAGRDFHNFNMFFRDNDAYRVVAFTATQIPDIAGRVYPAALAGSLYPDGIPIVEEERLEEVVRGQDVDLVVFAYSDVSHEHVMHMASRALAAGADFMLLGPQSTQIRASKPVVAVGAVRTGCGKSQTSRRIVQILSRWGLKVVVLRHPMPYGDLARQAVQRFATMEDLDVHRCTIEEREEYEPHLASGAVVYAGVDYAAIAQRAQDEADIIIWEGGNNDFPFLKPDLLVTIVDPHRPGHELTYHPGETCLRMADVVVINKVGTADFSGVHKVRESVRLVNPRAVVIEAASPVFIEGRERLAGARVLVIEDGPTVTHGSMAYGAGAIVAQKHGAVLVDPRPHAVGSIAATYKKYPHLQAVLPAMGYGEEQMRELRETIEATPCDLVVVATPIDVGKLLRLSKPALRARYELQEIGSPTMEDVLHRFRPC